MIRIERECSIDLQSILVEVNEDFGELKELMLPILVLNNPLLFSNEVQLLDSLCKNLCIDLGWELVSVSRLFELHLLI
jgi:hypothetical protein